MLKFIQFKDKRAVWSDIPHNVLGFACRTVEHLDVLPQEVMLEFNCTEQELGAIVSNRNLLQTKSREYHVPEIQLNYGTSR